MFSSTIFVHMTNTCTPHQFLLNTILHSNLHSHFIHFLLSALLTPKPGPSPVSAIASIAFMYAGVTHELSTFLLRFRDLCLSPNTPLSHVQAFAPAEIIIVTKALNLLDFAL